MGLLISTFFVRHLQASKSVAAQYKAIDSKERQSLFCGETVKPQRKKTFKDA